MRVLIEEWDKERVGKNGKKMTKLNMISLEVDEYL